MSESATVSIIYDKGEVISCRVFDPVAMEWWVTGTTWTATEASATTIALTETTLADEFYNRFSGTFTVPSGAYVIEFVDYAGDVIGDTERTSPTLAEILAGGVAILAAIAALPTVIQISSAV